MAHDLQVRNDILSALLRGTFRQRDGSEPPGLLLCEDWHADRTEEPVPDDVP